jgi:broad specificity phosphatase PhoE
MECRLVRHGEATWNLGERLQRGHALPLSSRRHVQAAALGARVAGMAFTGFYTSPLSRDRETAAVCAPMLGLAPKLVDDLDDTSHLAAATAGTAAP